jgi:hypothetical protein
MSLCSCQGTRTGRRRTRQRAVRRMPSLRSLMSRRSPRRVTARDPVSGGQGLRPNDPDLAHGVHGLRPWIWEALGCPTANDPLAQIGYNPHSKAPENYESRWKAFSQLTRCLACIAAGGGVAAVRPTTSDSIQPADQRTLISGTSSAQHCGRRSCSAPRQRGRRSALRWRRVDQRPRPVDGVRPLVDVRVEGDGWCAVPERELHGLHGCAGMDQHSRVKVAGPAATHRGLPLSAVRQPCGVRAWLVAQLRA